MGIETCARCGMYVYDEYAYECPLCGNIVCFACFDGEMCDDCRQAASDKQNKFNFKEYYHDKHV